MRAPPYNTPYTGPDHRVRCAICNIGVMRSRTVFMLVDAPGYPRKRMLVHPECWDQPNPRAIRPKPTAPKPPDVIQFPEVIETATVYTPTITTATTPVPFGVQSTVTLAGVNFNTFCHGRVNGQVRPTTFTSATSMTMTVYASDAVQGAAPLRVDVQTLRLPNTTDYTPAAMEAARFSNSVLVVIS